MHMNIWALQINPTVGDIKGNKDLILNALDEINGTTCDILVTPELAICGYAPCDYLLNKDFVSSCRSAVEEIASAVNEHTWLFVGMPTENPAHGEKPLHNSCAICHNGKIVKIVHKTLLPTYDVFDEARYFEPSKNPEDNIIHINGRAFGVTICEDIWNEGFSSDPTIYNFRPVYELWKNRADIIVNLSASPFVAGKPLARAKMVQEICTNYNVSMIYVNQVGANDSLVFDGRSMMVAPQSAYGEDAYFNANVAPAFESCIYNLGSVRPSGVFPTANPMPFEEYFEHPINDIRSALVLGIRDYFNKLGFKKAIIGMSGGVDSAVTAALAAEALGVENVFGISMPTKFNSEGTKSDAREQAGRMGIKFAEIPIQNIFTESCPNIYDAVGLLQAESNDDDFNNQITEQNIQARLRGMILMGVSNEIPQSIVVSTGNKSELSMGYCVSGDSLIPTSAGLLTAREIYEEANFPLASGHNSIIAAYKSTKTKSADIFTDIGGLRCSADHEVKVFDLEKRKECFVEAEKLDPNRHLQVMQIIERNWTGTTEIPKFTFERSKWDFRSHDFDAPRHLDESICQFIGLCVADGSFGDGVYRIRSAKDSVADFCSEFLSTINLPQSCWRVTDRDSNGCFFVEVSSVQFMAWLRHIGVEHGAYNKVVPAIIRRAPSNLIKCFLSGVMMDSTANYSKPLSEILYHTMNRELALEVQGLLLQLGVMCRLREKMMGMAVVHEVYIPATETTKMLVGYPFLKGKIRERIEQNADRTKYKETTSRLYCEPELLRLAEILGYNKSMGLRSSLKKNRSVGRHTALSYIDKLTTEQLADPAIRKILQIIEDGIYYVPIRTVSVEECEEQMFDFSMAAEEEYIANGCVVHNCTIYGDMCGGLNALGDVYKTEVFEIAKQYSEWIPESVWTRPPSAELAENQVDEDSLPPYDVLDPLLRIIVDSDGNASPEQRHGVEGLISNNWPNPWPEVGDASDNQKFDAFFRKVERMVRLNEYKRQQGAPCIKVNPRTLTNGWRRPIVANLRMNDG